MALEAAGGLLYWAGDLQRSHRCYQQQLEAAREMGDLRGQGEAWYNMAFALHVSGEPQAGKAAVAEAERVFVELDDRRWLDRIEWARSLGLTQTGSREEQRAAMLALAERLSGQDDPVSRAQENQMRAQVAMLDGDAPRAVTLIAAGLRIAWLNREYVDMIIALQPVAMGALQAGLAEMGAKLLGISDGEAERYGIMRPASMAQVTGVPDPEKLFVDALGRDGFESARAEGRRMTLADAVDLLEGQAAVAAKQVAQER